MIKNTWKKATRQAPDFNQIPASIRKQFRIIKKGYAGGVEEYQIQRKFDDGGNWNNVRFYLGGHKGTNLLKLKWTLFDYLKRQSTTDYEEQVSQEAIEL